MKARGLGRSDVGLERENNEDRFLVDNTLGAFVVCDGMGGHACGEKASEVAIDSVAKSIQASAQVLEGVRAGAEEGHSRLVGIAERAVRAACRDVYSLGCEKPEFSGMGCTMTLLLIAHDKAAIAHVGDTRLYLLRDGGIDQLTSDHTLAAELVRQGKLTPEAARTHRLSNALTRCVGGQGTAEVETLIFDVLPDDVLLLCSDGLSHYLESQGELATYLDGQNGEGTLDALIELANGRGGKDNVTALIVTVSASDDERRERMRLEGGVRKDLATLRAAELFGGIPYAHVLRLYAASKVRHHFAGEVVLRPGMELEGLCCVLSGRLQLRREDGSEHALSPGDAFGGASLLLHGESKVSVTVAEECRLLVLDEERFRRLASARPRVALTLLSRVAQNALVEDGENVRLGLRRRAAWWNPLAWARKSDDSKRTPPAPVDDGCETGADA